MTTYPSVATAALTWRHIVILLLGRFALNTAFRIVYPLLPFLASGLAVDLRVASLLVTVQVAATMLSPLGGTLSDARGEHVTMTCGLLLFCVGALVCALAQGFGLFLFGYAIIGLATAFYHPSAQAYASARTPYAQRGQVLGALELGWALAALLGVTALSRLVESSTTWAPAFWVLLGIGALILAATFFGLPRDRPAVGPNASPAPLNLAVLIQPSVAAALVLMFCTLLAIELIFVVYGAWLQADFGATTEQLGLIFGLLGFSELAGSIGSALLVDRIGKRRAVLLGFSATALAQLLLPISNGNWLLFLPLFLLFSFCMEFAIVSSFPLISGLAPAARGTVLAFSVTAIGLGRVFGSLLATPLWENHGFLANGVLAATLSLLGVIIGAWFVCEGER